MDNSRLVYSTETGRICPNCENSATKCRCKKGKKAQKMPAAAVYPNDGIVRIRREVKGRRGKTVTAVFGIPLQGRELDQFAKRLKQRCGTGGSVKDGVIVIQGDHGGTLQDEIKKQGYCVRRSGG